MKINLSRAERKPWYQSERRQSRSISQRSARSSTSPNSDVHEPHSEAPLAFFQTREGIDDDLVVSHLNMPRNFMKYKEILDVISSCHGFQEFGNQSTFVISFQMGLFFCCSNTWIVALLSGTEWLTNVSHIKRQNLARPRPIFTLTIPRYHCYPSLARFFNQWQTQSLSLVYL